MYKYVVPFCVRDNDYNNNNTKACAACYHWWYVKANRVGYNGAMGGDTIPQVHTYFSTEHYNFDFDIDIEFNA